MRFKYHHLLVCVFAIIGASCHLGPDPLSKEHIIYPDGKQETAAETIDATIKDGMEISILPSEWVDYYHAKDLLDIKSYYQSGVENTKPRYPILRWTHELGCSNYEVVLSTNKKMEQSTSFIAGENKYLELQDLYAGTHYFYQIQAKYDDKTIVSKRFDFKTIDFMRTIDIDGVYNARDIGNKKTKDGKMKIKQGLVYRTANFDSVTQLGVQQAINKYGIKTDLDLREQGPTKSPLGDSVQYVNNGQGIYGSPLYVSYDSGVNSIDYFEPMRDNLKMFTNKDNFPLAFHCAIGRDRTGTLATVLYLLLKIDMKQIYMDHLCSFYSKACNTESIDLIYERIDTLVSFFKGNSDDGNDAYKFAEKYCLTIGLTNDDIKAIRNNLLEKC